MAKRTIDWEKRREEIRNTMASMDEQIASYFETPEQLGEYLAFMAKMYDYSPRNSAMIQGQFSGAVAVGSYKFWKDKGFSVNKGESGIKVLVPSKAADRFKSTDGQLKNVRSATKQEKEQIEKGQLEKINGSTYFNFGHVFDVSQTNAKASDLPTIFPNRWLEGSVENYALIMNTLNQIADDLNVSVGLPLGELGAAKGAFYHSINNENDTKGHIGLNPRNSELQNVKTMIHELAHAKLHAGEKVLTLSSEEKEFQAEMVVYTTASYFGIDTSDYSLSYLAHWTQGKELKEKERLLKEVQETSLEFVKTIEQELLNAKELQFKEPSEAIQKWAEEMELKHSSTIHYDYYITHVFECEDHLIDLNEDLESERYELIASKEIDDFEPYLMVESETLEGLNTHIYQIKYGKTSKEIDSGALEL